MTMLETEHEPDERMPGIDWWKFLEDDYISSVGEESNRLVEHMLRKRRREGQSALAKRLLRHRFCQVLLLCLWMTAVVICATSFHIKTQAARGIAFRFTRNGNNHTSDAIPNIRMMSACDFVEPWNHSSSSGIVTLSYRLPVEIDGWSYDQIHGAQSFEWTVEMKTLATASFQPLERRVTKCKRWSVPWWTRSNDQVEFALGADSQPSAPLVSLTAPIGLGLTLVFCWTGRLLRARRTLAVTQLVLAVLLLARAGDAANRGWDDVAVRHSKEGALLVMLLPFVAISALGHLFSRACMALGALMLVLQFATWLSPWLGPCGESEAVAGNVLTFGALGILVVGLSLVLVEGRRQTTGKAVRERYSARLDEEWAQVLREERSAALVVAIARHISARNLSLAPKLLQTFPLIALDSKALRSPTLPCKSGSREVHNVHTLAGASAEVDNLEQLYALAAGAQQLLRALVQKLALAHRGLVPLTARRATLEDAEQLFVRYSEAQDREVLWASLKPREQAVKKVVGKYRGEVCRLLDVSRESLVFDDLEDLLGCLNALLAEPDLRIVRIQNSMSMEGEARRGVVRAVVLNLRFESGAARSLGLQGHVCELRLLLKSFALCLTDELARAVRLAPAASLWQRNGSSRVHPWALSHSESSISICVPPSGPPPARAHPAASPPQAASRASSRASLPSPPSAATAMVVHGSLPPVLPVPLRRPSRAAPAELPIEPIVQAAARATDGAAVVSAPEPALELRRRASESLAPLQQQDSDTSSFLGQQRRPSAWGTTWTLFRRRSSAELHDAGSLSLSAEWPAALGPRPAACWHESVPPEVLLEQYRVRALRLGPDEVREGAPTLRESVDRCRAMSVLSTSFPIAAALRKKTIPLFFLIVAIGCAFNLLEWPAQLAPQVRASSLRLRALELRNPLAVPHAPVIQDLGVRFRGCAARTGNRTLSISEDWLEYTLSFLDGAVSFDEVHLATASSPPDLDPVRFVVEGSTDGQTWTRVAASRKVVQADGSVRFDADAQQLPTERGKEVSYSLAAIWVVGEKVQYVVIFLTAVGTTTLSLSKQYQYGRPLFLAGAFVAGLSDLVSSGVRLSLGLYHVFPLEMLSGVLYWASVWTIYARESLILEVFVANSVMQLLMVSLQNLVLDWSPELVLDEPPWTAIAATVLSLAMLSVKLRTHRADRRIFAQDHQYNAAWASLCDEPLELAAFTRIAAALDLARLPAAPARQLFRPSSPSAPLLTLSRCSRDMAAVPAGQLGGASRTPSAASSRSGSAPSPPTRRSLRAGTPPAQPVGTTGLLFRQAAGVYYLALHKVWEWCQATPSGGMLPVKVAGQPELVQLKGLVSASSAAAATPMGKREEEGGGSGEAGWTAVHSLPPLKSVGRASQKLMRAYGADASRLMDVCRFALVFDHAWELADAVEAICGDAQVQVVGAKNRLRKDYDSRLSGGFRDVHLNLRMVSPEAARLGIDTHVWELQLTLSSIWQLRNDGGHRRYVEHRDARAE